MTMADATSATLRSVEVQDAVNVTDNGRPNTDYYFGKLRIPRYRTPMAQVVMVGLIAFCTV
jgi:hypothetical protein